MKISNVGPLNPDKPAVIDGEGCLVLTYNEYGLNLPNSSPSSCQIHYFHFLGVGHDFMGNLRATVKALRYIWRKA